MKKIITLIFLTLLFPSILFAKDFVSCTENADTSYSEEEESLKEAHQKEVGDLESAKDLAIKDAFHIASIRVSFAKMKTLRAEYKAKITESENIFKKNLELLSIKHDEAIELCLLTKKEMTLQNEN